MTGLVRSDVAIEETLFFTHRCYDEFFVVDRVIGRSQPDDVKVKISSERAVAIDRGFNVVHFLTTP